LSETLIALTTNGTLLTQQLVDELADLRPLELTVSLNSVTEHGRLLLLNDRDPHRALDGIARLANLGMPFHGSLVAMPHLTGMEDIAETVDFLAEHGALTVRIFLPGYTRFAPEDLRFPLSLWDELVAIARELTVSTGVPVIPEPSVLHSLTPEIYGVIRDTPADCAGVLAGDTILSVDGSKARTRVEAFKLAQKVADPKLQLMRDGKLLEISLDKTEGQPPGFVVQYDLDAARIEQIGGEIICRSSVSPLLLASQLGLPVVRAALEQLGFAPSHVQPVTNRFFGGSIQSAGLLTVEDLLAAAKELPFTPDLALVPREAFDHKGCDLTGRNIKALDETLGIPVVAV
jgi:NifB/MoaA-like Fe-S oxidoreductase